MKANMVAAVLVLMAVGMWAVAAGDDKPEWSGAVLGVNERNKMILAALESSPPDTDKLTKALQDVGHVEAVYRSKPLRKWVEEAEIIDGAIYIKSTLTLNRRQPGAAPAEWVEKLLWPAKNGLSIYSVKLALAPPETAKTQRDRFLAIADVKLRTGLRADVSVLIGCPVIGASVLWYRRRDSGRASGSPSSTFLRRPARPASFRDPAPDLSQGMWSVRGRRILCRIPPRCP